MTEQVFTDLSWTELGRLAARLFTAIALGATIGWERERRQRWAGLRTHILVTLSAAALMTLGIDMSAGRPDSDPARIIQGVAAGIGFLGAGTILKTPDQRRIEGLTTASSIWTAATVGVAIGAGHLLLASLLALLALVVLHFFRIVERSSKQARLKQSARLSTGSHT